MNAREERGDVFGHAYVGQRVMPASRASRRRRRRRADAADAADGATSAAAAARLQRAWRRSLARRRCVDGEVRERVRELERDVDELAQWDADEEADWRRWRRASAWADAVARRLGVVGGAWE